MELVTREEALAKLRVAIIVQAFEDAHNDTIIEDTTSRTFGRLTKNSQIKKDALDFITTSRIDEFCDHNGMKSVNVNRLRSLLKNPEFKSKPTFWEAARD